MNQVSLTPRGTLFARYAKAIAVGGSFIDGMAYAEGQNWADTAAIVPALKAAVAAQTTQDLLVATAPIAFDFAEFLRPQSIVGKLTGFRRVPFNVRTLRGTAGTAAAFVGQNKSTPVTKEAFAQGTTLGLAKVSSIVVVTKELLRNSTPSADATLSADLGSATGQALDLAFIDPTNAGIADEKPASVTYGAPTVASTGTTLAAIDADLKALVQKFFDVDVPLVAAAWIMNPKTATFLGMLRGSGGAPASPGIGPKGGTLLGIPVITSTTVSGFIALVDASEILRADDGQATFDKTEEAAIQMDSAPTNPPVAATVMVSLWQMNLAAIKSTRFINWQARRTEAAAVLTGVTY